MNKKNNTIKEKYNIYISEITVKTLNIKLIFALLILFYFVYLDFHAENITSFYTRLLPITLGLSLLITNFITKSLQITKKIIYNIFLISLILMMYSKIIIYLYQDIELMVSGTILVIFLVSIDIKTNLRNTIIIYFLPSVILAILIFWNFDITNQELYKLSNILPIIIIGFLINRIQEDLRYKTFKANHLLVIERSKTNKLYEKTQNQNKKISDYADKLKIANNSKDKLFSIIAHDLKSPFNSIIGLSDLLKNDLHDFSMPEIKESISTIHKKSKQTYNLLVDLLEWTRVQSNKIDFKPEKILLNKIIQDNIKIFEDNARKKSISIIFNQNKDIIAHSDLYMLNAILRNLISNAIKFTHSGKIEIFVKETPNNFKVSIKDTGIGISKEKLDNLFKIEKAYSTNGTNGETGTGLGLNICKEFIEKTKGEIFAESTENQGSIFTFTLPCS